MQVCDWGLVSAGVVLSIPVAFPASHSVVAPLSYWLTRASSEGINFLENFHEPTYHSVCSLKIDASNTEDGVQPLQLGNFVGSIAVMVLGTMAGVVIKLFSERDRAAQAMWRQANGHRWGELMLQAKQRFSGALLMWEDARSIHRFTVHQMHSAMYDLIYILCITDD